MLKKLLMISIFSFSLYAEGVGIYMLNVINEKGYDSYEDDYGYSPGIGLSFDTNLGKNKIFSYRLNFEYYRADGTDTYRPFDSNIDVKYDIHKNVVSVVNIIGFGVYRSKHIRLWLGPIVSVNSENTNAHHDYEDAFTNNNLEVGPVTGLNYNINEAASLSIDISYGLLSTGTTSAKARVYLFWRFGETFEPRKPKIKKKKTMQSTSQPRQTENFEEKLHYLKSLRDKEILTEEEYQLKRKELIDTLKL